MPVAPFFFDGPELSVAVAFARRAHGPFMGRQADRADYAQRPFARWSQEKFGELLILLALLTFVEVLGVH